MPVAIVRTSRPSRRQETTQVEEIKMVNDPLMQAIPKLTSKLVVSFIPQLFLVFFSTAPSSTSERWFHVIILDYRDIANSAPFTCSKSM